MTGHLYAARQSAANAELHRQEQQDARRAAYEAENGPLTGETASSGMSPCETTQQRLRAAIQEGAHQRTARRTAPEGCGKGRRIHPAIEPTEDDW